MVRQSIGNVPSVFQNWRQMLFSLWWTPTNGCKPAANVTPVSGEQKLQSASVGKGSNRQMLSLLSWACQMDPEQGAGVGPVPERCKMQMPAESNSKVPLLGRAAWLATGCLSARVIADPWRQNTATNKKKHCMHMHALSAHRIVKYYESGLVVCNERA